ncbi:MAG: nucleotidyl transferase AbiEii/AbiGii toxin family protein [Candidatus Magasanikbacteria bacterium]|nr:nucleotidyl transferase AbiEii/AbiGii toxin family protein [Candidatus Magasanikbacteria bacterium]
MAVTNTQLAAFHFETLPKETKKAFDFLSKQDWLKKSKWYLAGGTALALHSGNRRSVDLDFFTEKKSFDMKRLLSKFLDNPDWTIQVEDENTIYGELFKAKVSFIAYPFFVPKQKPHWHGTVRILDPLDIAVMKIVAISQRGRKRDFFDLYWCANHLESLENTVKRLKIQYPSVAHDFHHILKSLVYFVDAESDPEPEIYFKATWPQVKSFFKKEVPALLRKILHLN